MGKIYCLMGNSNSKKLIIKKHMIDLGFIPLELTIEKCNNIDLDNNNYICAIEPMLYKKILEKTENKKIIGIYLHDNNKFISNVNLFHEIEGIVDYIIDGITINESINLILKQIGLNYNLNESIIIPLSTKVKIRKINNLTKANHLEKFIGKYGYIFTNHVIWKNKRRYKVLFTYNEYNETAYFRYDELEIINF